MIYDDDDDENDDDALKENVNKLFFCRFFFLFSF